MGLITEYVTTKINSQFIKYYEEKGYVIPKKPASDTYKKKTGKEFCYNLTQPIKIKVKDLPSNSSAKVEYACDDCGKNIISTYQIYNEYIHDDGKRYCKDCGIKHYSSGENHPFWNPEIHNNERVKNRTIDGYSKFVKEVMNRDNYSCIVCGIKSNGKNMEVHHLNGYIWDKENRTNPANGVTLCNHNGNGCHENYHSLYGKKHNTKEQFEDWLGYRLTSLENYEHTESNPAVYCIEDDKIYKDRFECAKLLNCSPSSIYYVCHGGGYSFHGKHFLYYYDYLKKSEEEIKELLSKGKIYRSDKSVLCLITGLKFESPRSAAKFYNYKYVENINNCCNKIQKRAAKYNDIYLQWMWYMDYMNLSTDKQKEILLNNYRTFEEGSFLMQQYNELIKNKN